MTQYRAFAKRLVLANWKGIIFHCFDLDRHVTGLEGQNGAGKTTVMAAYVSAILPNHRLLTFKNVNGASGSRSDGGLWGRIGEDGICYSLIEWVTPKGKTLWAGVAMTRGQFPSIDSKLITIHDLSSDASAHDTLLLHEQSGAIVPPLARLREHVAMHGARLVVHKSLADYMKVLFDHGITPMPMTTYDEQERFYRVLSTSMEGSALSTLIKTGLRDYLLSPDASLERRIVLMRESLEQCRQTRRSLELAEVAHREISELFEAAWKMASYAYFGARGRYEQEARSWKERVADNREAERRCLTQQAEVTHLRQRVEALKRDVSMAQSTLDVRKDDLQSVNRALSLRCALVRAVDERTNREAQHAAAAEKRAQAEVAEHKALQTLRLAQDDHTRIAQELGDVQLAVEALMRRVMELRIAREYLADAREAMRPFKLDRDNAVAAKRRVDQQYMEETQRHAMSQAEFDALNDHLERFEVLHGKLRTLARAEKRDEPDDTAAYGEALVLETRARDYAALAARRTTLQSELAHARATATQQAQVRRQAAVLNIYGSTALAEALSATASRTAELESKREQLTRDIFERQASLVEAKGRIPSLEEAARRHKEVSALHEQLTLVSAAWGALTKMDAMVEAVDVARRELSDTDEGRRRIEARLHRMGERILSLEQGAGLLDPRLGAIAEHVEGSLLATRFDELPVAEAASVQARLGAWTDAIVVDAPEHAARQAATLSDRPDTVLFLSAQAVHTAQAEHAGTRLDDSELVVDRQSGKSVARLTRLPQHPVLGHRAREIEAVRLKGERDAFQDDLARLREQSRLLKEGVRLMERMLSFGAAAWAIDPRPALHAEYASMHTLNQAIAGRQTSLAAVCESLAEIGHRRQRMMALQTWGALLDAPDYQVETKRIEAQVDAARDAQTWIDQNEAMVREILDGLPVLSRVVAADRRVQLEQMLQRYRVSRDRLAGQREALEKLLGVIGHLDRADDERNFNESNSVIAELKVQIRHAENHLAAAREQDGIKRAEVDRTRTEFSETSSALSRIADKCEALAGELTATGYAGTDEEARFAEQAHAAAVAEARRLDAEHETTNNDFIERRTSLRTLEERFAEQRQLMTQQLTTIRFERRAQRELERIVVQLSLGGKIDSDLNRQQHFPTGSLINAFQSSQQQQGLLLERLKPWSDVVTDLKRIDGFYEPSNERRAVQTLRAWERVRRHIEQRIPRNLATADDAQVALAQMSEKMSELKRTLTAQEDDMRTRSSGLADGIAARQRSARSLVIRLNRELEKVSFGSIKGLQISISYPENMVKMLACLKQDNSLSMFDSSESLDDTLARLYERETGGTIQGMRLFDYRNYLQLKLEVRRIDGKWEASSEVSTGEAIGTGAAVLVMILRTWNEEANRISGASGFPMQQILLDEANRLDDQALDTLTEFCQRMDVQALVAAPGLDRPRRSTVFQLSRSLRGNHEFVTIRGTRIL